MTGMMNLKKDKKNKDSKNIGKKDIGKKKKYSHKKDKKKFVTDKLKISSITRKIYLKWDKVLTKKILKLSKWLLVRISSGLNFSVMSRLNSMSRYRDSK